MRRRLVPLFSLIALPGVLAAATPAFAVDSFFDIFTEVAITAPPYPSSPVITIVGSNFNNNFQATQQVEVGTSSLAVCCLPPGTPVIPIRMVGGGGGSGGTAPGIDSFFDVFFEVDMPTPLTGRRISDIRIVHPPGTPPGMWRLVPINPGAPPGSAASFFDIFVDANFFDITYRVRDDVGEHTYHSHVTSPSGRMSFFDVFCELRNPAPYANGTVDSFFDVFCDFQMAGPQGGAPDMRVHTTGTFEGGPTPTAGTSWGALKGFYR